MKVILSCSILLVLLVSAAFQQETPQKPLPPDRDAFTFLVWNLDVRIDAKTESLFVRGKITMRNDSTKPQAQIPLQISSSLKWASIRRNGKAVPFSTSQLRSDLDHSGNAEEAIVSLPSPIAPRDSIELEVGYSGTVSLDTTRLIELGVPLEVRVATDFDRITPTFTCLRGVGHVLWFPVSLEPAVISDGNRVFEETSAWAVRHAVSSMTLNVAIDSTPPVHTNGQISIIRQEDRVRFDEGHQWTRLGLSGPVLVGGNYREIIARKDRDAPFSVIFFPEHVAQAQDYARVIQDTLPTVTGKSDFPASLIELPESDDATYDADTVLLTPLKTIDRKSLEVTLAYMFAHQTLWSPRAWIYEGVAHLAQVLMRERQDGRAAAVAYMGQRLSPLTLAESGAAGAARSNSLVNTTSEVFYRTKAMYVWWMLREIVGERALLDSLQQYDSEQDKEPSYIQKLLEKNSRKDLEWFFDDWVYQDRGLPEFVISNGYARPSLQGIFLVSATIENTGSVGAEVPVIVHTVNGDVVSRLRVPAHTKKAARIEVGSKPIDVTVNDGSVPETNRSDNTTSVRIGEG